MVSGALAGRTFQTTQQYNNALARVQGFNTYAQLRAFHNTPQAKGLFGRFQEIQKRPPSQSERRSLISQYRKAAGERSYKESKGFEQRRGSEFEKFLQMLGVVRGEDGNPYQFPLEAEGEDINDISSALDEAYEVEEFD